MRRLLSITVLLLAAAASPARAVDCKNAVTTVDIVDCAKRELDAADRRLNDAYQRLMKGGTLDDAGRSLLRDAQRKWIAFRDADCAFDADQMRGGTGAAILHVSCLGRMTQERVKLLEEALTGR